MFLLLLLLVLLTVNENGTHSYRIPPVVKHKKRVKCQIKKIMIEPWPTGKCRPKTVKGIRNLHLKSYQRAPLDHC